MCASKLDLCVVGFVSVYPDGCAADAEEQRIEMFLPPVEGLVPGMSQVQRVAVLGKAIQEQREAFISMYGDPFGTERRSESRAKVIGTNLLPAAGVRKFTIGVL